MKAGRLYGISIGTPRLTPSAKPARNHRLRAGRAWLGGGLGAVSAMTHSIAATIAAASAGEACGVIEQGWRPTSTIRIF